MISDSKTETINRLELVKKINSMVATSKLTGLLVTGSLAWGKDYAVNEKSDVDFYFLARNKEDYENSLKDFDFFPEESIKIIKRLLKFNAVQVDTRSIKTAIGNFHGAVYFFLENDLERLTEKIDLKNSTYFKNLRTHDFPQHKTYISTQGKKVNFTTPLEKADKDGQLYIRTDPLTLIENDNFYGSIFVSHILYGDIYTDKNKVLVESKQKIAKTVKKFLDRDADTAYTGFITYLPRSERMDKKTKRRLFSLVWEG